MRVRTWLWILNTGCLLLKVQYPLYRVSASRTGRNYAQRVPWHRFWIDVLPLCSWFGATASWRIPLLRTLLWTTSSTPVSSTVGWRARSAERCSGRSCRSWGCRTGRDPTSTESTTLPRCLCWTCTTPCPQRGTRTDTPTHTSPSSPPRAPP